MERKEIRNQVDGLNGMFGRNGNGCCIVESELAPLLNHFKTDGPGFCFAPLALMMLLRCIFFLIPTRE